MAVQGNINKAGVLQVQALSKDGKPVVIDLEEVINSLVDARLAAMEKPKKAAVETKPISSKGGDK